MELILQPSVLWDESITLEMKMKKIFLVIAIVLLALASCSNASADITGGWKLVSYGDASNPTPAIQNVDTLIRFESNGQVGGNVGCNSFGGNYEMSGDTIAFNSIISTMMFCEGASAQETAVLGIFSDNVKLPVHLNGDTVTITSANGDSAVTLARK